MNEKTTVKEKESSSLDSLRSKQEKGGPCGDCKWWDKSTIRDFKRDGIRKGLVEVRAVCRTPKKHSKASGHLTKRESIRPCFQRGSSVYPNEEKKQLENVFEQSNGEIKKEEEFSVKNTLNGEKKTFVKKKNRILLKE